MLINLILIKLFQSAAERSNLKQACKLKDSTWGEVQEVCPASPLNMAACPHGYCTSPSQTLQPRTAGEAARVTDAPESKAAPGTLPHAVAELAREPRTGASPPCT